MTTEATPDTRTDQEKVIDFLGDFARKSFFALSLTEQYVERTQELVTQLLEQFEGAEELKILHDVGAQVLEAARDLTSETFGRPDEETEEV